MPPFVNSTTRTNHQKIEAQTLDSFFQIAIIVHNFWEWYINNRIIMKYCYAKELCLKLLEIWSYVKYIDQLSQKTKLPLSTNTI